MKNGWIACTALLVASALAGCGDDKGQTPTTATTSTASAATPMGAMSAASTPASKSVTKLAVKSGKATFLIDAPLEKIKGASEDLEGSFDVDVEDLSKSKGTVKVKLATLKTNTFDSKDQNEKQTEHARNWMEATKAEFMWATFTIDSIETATKALSSVAEEGGERKVKLKAMGSIDLHGKKSPKTLMLSVSFKGPADHPTEMTAKTDEPVAVSLKEHDIMPRDTVGKFLAGQLEKVGQKIDDKVQVSLEVTAKM